MVDSNLMLSSKTPSFTTSPPLNYQYDDIVDDTINLESDDLENNQEFINSYDPIAEAIFDDQQTNSLDKNSLKLSNSNQTNRNLDSVLSFEKRNDESNEFRVMIVCIGLLIISIGILSNLIFSLLIICRKRKRQTSSTLLMSSMCLAYLIFLIFYCFKISIYFNVDTIIKFHIYDITENWIYGAFLCKFISGLPICCKLISRMSILALTIKRIFNSFTCENSSKSSSKSNSQDLINENDNIDLNVNILKTKKTKRSDQKIKNTPAKLNKLNILKNVCECPFLVIVILFIWIASLSATWPVFSAYKLTEFQNTAICDSTFDFPNDIKKFSSIYLNYLLYGLTIPCALILLFLIVLFIIQSSNLSSRPSSASSSSQSTPTKKKSKSQSFDEINLSSNQQIESCTKTRSNNFMLWVMFFLHLSSSLPQELYRYFQLTRDNFEDKNVLESYLEMALEKPLIRARPYYSMQLIYISEFALMPLIFILFYACSSKLKKTKSESNTALSGNKKSTVGNILTSCFYDDDLVKSNVSSKNIYNDKAIFSQRNENSLNDALLDANQPINQFQSNEPKYNYNYNAKKSINTNSSSLKPTPFELATNGNLQDQPTTYSYNLNSNGIHMNANNPNSNNSNVLHIIQHPSWRINIKQPNTPNINTNPNNHFHQNNSHLFNEENGNEPVQLPFRYMKTNMYNS